MRTRTMVGALLVVIAVLGAGCSSVTDDRADQTSTTAGPADAPETGFVELRLMDSGSPYVQGLCSIDFFDPGDEEDPMGWLVEELRDLPSTTQAESEEVDWMIERIERADELDDPTETDDLSSVAAVLRARCSP